MINFCVYYIKLTMEVKINEFCCGCLSSDRKMKILKDFCKDYDICKLFAENSNIMLNASSLSLCWQCASCITSFSKFHKQIHSCYQVLQSYVEGDEKPQTVSNLQICTPTIISITESLSRDNIAFTTNQHVIYCKDDNKNDAIPIKNEVDDDTGFDDIMLQDHDIKEGNNDYKIFNSNNEFIEDNSGNTNDTVKKKKGRPKRVYNDKCDEIVNDNDTDCDYNNELKIEKSCNKNGHVKKKRGRPKRVYNDKSDEIVKGNDTDCDDNNEYVPERLCNKNGIVKKKRGRPKKFFNDVQCNEISNENDIGNTYSDYKNEDIVTDVCNTNTRKTKISGKKLFEKIILTPEEIEQERMTMAQRDEYINAMFKCDKCIIPFPNTDDLNEHVIKKHEMHTEFCCNVCSRTFASSGSLAYHVRAHSRRLRCVECRYTCAGVRHFTLHYKEMHSYSESLELIEKVYNKEQLPSQENESKSDAQFSCHHCEKTFIWKTSLRKHLETHSIEAGQKRKPYCEPCRLTFTSTSNLYHHVKASSKHQIKLKLWKLKESQPTADSEHTAQEIEGIKSDINRKKELYPCTQCEKKFQWKGNLARHLHSHVARATGSLVCSPCNRTFASLATYTQHMNGSKKHVTEEQFKYMCSDCGKKFPHKTKLRDHIDWEHLKRFNHKCEHCHKVFKSNPSLYLHMQVVHKKMTPEHLCDYCGKPFPNHTKLRIHINAVHTRENPYKCVKCTAQFGWYSCLLRHVKKLHTNGGQ